MATITSAQTGWWGDPTTWVGGVVPDMSIDDAVVLSGHAVVIEPESYVVLVDGRTLTVESGGLLAIIGGLEVFQGGSLPLYGDLIIVPSGYLSVYDSGGLWAEGGSSITLDGSLNVEYYGYCSTAGSLTCGSLGSIYVTYYGNFETHYPASLSIQGLMDVDYDGYLYVDYSQITVEANGSMVMNGQAMLQYYGTIDVYGTLVAEGQFQLEYSGMLQVQSGGMATISGYVTCQYDGGIWAQGGQLVVGPYGSIDAYYYGRFGAGSGVIDMFGWLYIYQDGMLEMYGGLMRVYRDIYISGLMYGGGKISMQRRDLKICDANGNSLFVLDQAYGYGTTLIA